jgi:flagellar hook protein FlgE
MANIAGAQDGAAGSIISFAQEGSNVDIAEEFVKLIEAQRSFQASARIITTTDEILAELVNLV